MHEFGAKRKTECGPSFVALSNDKWGTVLVLLTSIFLMLTPKLATARGLHQQTGSSSLDVLLGLDQVDEDLEPEEGGPFRCPPSPIGASPP